MKDKDQRLIWESYEKAKKTPVVKPKFNTAELAKLTGTPKPTEIKVNKENHPKFAIAEREYGPSGAPSLDVSTWEMGDWYTVDEWENDTAKNPWTKYTLQAIQDLRDNGDDVEFEYVTFFMPKQGSADYEAWTDPGIVVAFDSTMNYSKGIFVDNDGEGEAHVLALDVVESLIAKNHNQIVQRINNDLDNRRREADDERYADRFSPFDRDY